MSAQSGTPRRGRPPGTVSLTAEKAAIILSYIRAGAFDHVAAAAAGVPDRTFRDWISRGQGRHPTRPPTPKFIAFAEEVGRAKAQARIVAETRVFKEQPALWLSRVARSKPDREGWTEPAVGAGHSATDLFGGLSQEDATEEFARVVQVLMEQGAVGSPPCSHPRCRCPHHWTWKKGRRTRRG